MFKIKWYENENLIKLTEIINEFEVELNSPRVVFTNELRLLGITKYKYPKENVPVCWCIERKYYYSGIFLFEAKGGDIYNAPKIKYNENSNVLELIQIDIKKLRDINEKQLSVLQNEAVDFIKEQYHYYERRVDAFAVAFSGGKDSQVTLDLVTRAISPDKYKVYYTDTGMELPCTYDIVNKTKDHYKKIYNNFELLSCQSEIPIIEQWENYGPPSRMNRWCCKVRKTALFTRKLKDTLNTKKQPKCVVFEGVRADESARREKYNRVGVGVKHINLINCRPIFNWNDAEIYIYMLTKCDLELNDAYKYGLTRVGCNICPFASSWSEYIINKIYPNIAKPFIQVIEKMAKNIGVTSQTKINEYISQGNWKKNAGGKGLLTDNTRMDILKKEPKYDCSILNPKQDWKAWLNTVGPYTIQKTNDKYIGEIKISHEILKFNVIEGDNKLRFQVDGTTGKISITSLFTKALTKTAFCERCGVCEAECPTGALRIRKNELYIDTTMCIHCHKCYDVNSYACIVAARKRVTEGGNNMNSTKTRTSGIDRYSTFGLKDEWVGSLVDLQNEWFAEYPGMGNKMIPASINWLREGGIIDLKDKKISEFGKVFSQLYNKNKYLAYQLLWVNLCFNSPIINFYVNKTACYSKYSKQDLLALLQYEYPGLKENTLSNPINAMYNMFEHISYFGSSEDMFQFEDYSIKMGVYSNIGKERYLKKIGTDNINKAAIVYLLYKQAEISGIYDFTLNDFYSSNVMGPSIVFNFPIEKFITMLRNLTENGILTAELQGGLDNIHLNKNFNSLELLKKMVF